MSTERFKVRSQTCRDMLNPIPPEHLCNETFRLPDGPDLPISHGGALLLHWSQLSAAVPPTAQGECACWRHEERVEGLLYRGEYEIAKL